MSRTVIIYRTIDGGCPIQDFLDSLSCKVTQKIVWVLKLLEDMDRVPSIFSRSLKEGKKSMSDLKKYIADRKKRDEDFSSGFDEGYEQFKIGVVLRHARETAGLTQEELALRLKTKKTAISRIENHAEDIKLSTLDRVAKALGKHLEIRIS